MAEWQTRRSQTPLMNNRKGSNPFLATTSTRLRSLSVSKSTTFEVKEMKDIDWDKACLEHMTDTHPQCPSCLNCGMVIDPLEQTEAENIEGKLWHKGCAEDAKIQFTAWKLLEVNW